MNPYYSDDWVTIYHGDCREVLPGLEFGAILADPPYGVMGQFELLQGHVAANHRQDTMFTQ
jgi:site-specific DNA-methyltransferase (adenine-specific)